MRLTIVLVLLAAATLAGGSFLNGARSAEMAVPQVSGTAPTGGLTDAVKRKFKLEADQREEANKKRQARTERLTRSVCFGCGGPIIPFDPTGGEAARKDVSPARHRKR